MVSALLVLSIMSRAFESDEDGAILFVTHANTMTTMTPVPGSVRLAAGIMQRGLLFRRSPVLPPEPPVNCNGSAACAGAAEGGTAGGGGGGAASGAAAAASGGAAAAPAEGGGGAPCAPALSAPAAPSAAASDPVPRLIDLVW
jgi:hypothetical protein